MKNAPSRDTIILWSAVIAGIGLLALLVRHAAIYRFGTDTFTGNVLFGVIFFLLVGLYLGFQSVIENFSPAISYLFHPWLRRILNALVFRNDSLAGRTHRATQNLRHQVPFHPDEWRLILFFSICDIYTFEDCFTKLTLISEK